MEESKKSGIYQITGVGIALVGHLFERYTGINEIGVSAFIVGFIFLIYGSSFYVKKLFGFKTKSGESE